jgi:hypothetical protein
MNEHIGHEDIRDSDRQSIISYDHGRMGFVVLLCVLFDSKAELA